MLILPKGRNDLHHQFFLNAEFDVSRLNADSDLPPAMVKLQNNSFSGAIQSTPSRTYMMGMISSLKDTEGDFL